MSEFLPYEPRARAEPETAPAVQPVGWLVWPARIIALGVVLPVRLLWDALRAAGRGLERVRGAALLVVIRALGFVLAPIGYLLLVPVRILGRWIFCPATARLGRLLRLFLVYVVLPVLAALRAGAAAVAHALAVGFCAVCSGLVAVARWIGHALAVLGRWVAVPLVLLWKWVLKPVVAGLGIVLIAIGMAAWQFVLRPLLLGIAALFRGIGAALRGTGRAIAWAWRTSGVLVAALGRFLVLLGRILATPFVWLYRHVLTPVGHAVRAVWRVCVLAPLAVVRRNAATASAAVRRASAQARIQVSAQMRVLFGRAR